MTTLTPGGTPLHVAMLYNGVHLVVVTWYNIVRRVAAVCVTGSDKHREPFSVCLAPVAWCVQTGVFIWVFNLSGAVINVLYRLRYTLKTFV